MNTFPLFSSCRISFDYALLRGGIFGFIKKSYEISKWMSGSAIRRGEAGNGSIRVSASGSNSPYFREQTYMRLIHLKPAEFFDTINGLAEEKFVLIADG